ncbi:uncharacterized protein LOC105915692 [Fundulus heteroclitus]|uniref:uncharacterized protein LOC105915692 n=1 Tax=Fundulus heteroclitus TaxID=8078 RepID=UPI00165BE721|nr:uncharacterized protein LOC105915692 [Fundulus heteroclitus]
MLLHLSLLTSAQTSHQACSSIQQDKRFISANVGESVILQCFHDPDAAARFHWYKVALDQKPQLISTVYKYNSNGTFYNEFKNNPRFTLDSKTHRNYLKITNLRTSDSATYYCITRTTYKIEFDRGTIIYVKGSELNIQTVVQLSETETIQPGGSVTLNCTVQNGSFDGEERVYWFKSSEEHYPGLMYTHGGSNDQCERKPGEQRNNCVYNLPLKNLNSSHAGTYYCAVASCGHILFGNGMKLDVEAKVDSVYLLRGALVFTTFLSVLQAFLLFVIYKRNHSKHSESSRRSTPSTATGEDNQNEENLHYAAFRTRRLMDQRFNKSANQRNENTDCVYSSVKF